MAAQSGGDEFAMQIPNNKVWRRNMYNHRHVFCSVLFFHVDVVSCVRH
jgi:hypothetical protein